MASADQLRQALEILGYRAQDLVVDRPEENLVVQLANGLAGVAEREIITAEMELGGPDAASVVDAAELNVDAAAGWDRAPQEARRTVMNWRAARLRNALDRAVEAAGDDPTLAAARDAATVALALLAYRSASELSLESSELAGAPESALEAARLLLTRIDDTLRRLTA